MSCCLTRHDRPRPSYGLALERASRWQARGGWRLDDDGSWRRVYVRQPVRRMRKARRAVVYRSGGLWFWRVEEFCLLTRAARRVCAAANRGRLFAEDAWAFADLAAKTAD